MAFESVLWMYLDFLVEHTHFQVMYFGKGIYIKLNSYFNELST